jgi:phage virion morphogenesis protein
VTGVRITLTGKEQSLAALRGVVERADNPLGMWERIGMSLVVSTQRRFEEGKAPDGSPWPPSVRALAEGGKTLIDTARLMQSQTYEASYSGVAVGTNVIYAAIHQLGGEIHRGSHVIRMPVRAFLGVDDDDEREIVAIAEDWLRIEEARR